MYLEAHTETQSFEQLKAEWNELLARSYANSVFTTWEWQTTWWDAYQPGQLWIITCRNDDGRLLGIAPWFIQEHPQLGRVVRTVGCVEVTDYLDVIIDRDCITLVLDALANYLVEQRDKFDVIDLCNLPESSPTPEMFPIYLQQHGFQVQVEQQEVCPIIKLPNSFEEYIASLGKKYRHELRRKIRRAEGNAQIDWYIVGPEHDLEAELNRFTDMMASSDPAKAEFLQDEQNMAFFKAMARVMLDAGWLQLNFLTVNGEPAAAYLNFDYGNRILVYNSGLYPEEFGHLSPGIVLLARNIRHAIEQGREEFDFLRGNEVYKYHMGGVDTAVFMLQARYNHN